ncbi:MAG: ATP-binding protein [Paludibacteraceae bacterium]|nr:ATP-binding protein [Paludibacteraceae bacterium]
MVSKEENVLITSEGIRNSLKRYRPLQALAEYIWNGFDAHATRVDVVIDRNKLDGTSYISVNDNGNGIDKDQLSQKFKPFFESEKIYNPDVAHSAIHGKNGVGRLTFFTFANLANWQTVFEKEGIRYLYEIEVNAGTLQNYRPGNDRRTERPIGTTVTFTDLLDTEITPDTAYIYLGEVFCWFLELNKDNGYEIYVNERILDYESLIRERETCNYVFDGNKTEFTVRYICWTKKLSEYSKYYYIDSDGKEIGKENTTLNNKGDHFYHSVYIQSKLFDHFNLGDVPDRQISMKTFANKQSPEYEFIMAEVNRHLFDIRRPFIKATVEKVVDALDIDAAFPNYNPKNPLDQYKKSQIADMVSAIYVAQPKIFTNSMNKEQRKTFIRLLDLIMDSGEVDSLFDVFDEILEMTELERHDLAEILKYAHLSNVTKTIKMIKDRYQAVEDLKQLVFNPDLKANEVNHLQKMIEKHYWLFGEQYNLVTAAEPNFEEALRRYLHYLHEEYENANVESPDKLKQMDIFAVRQDMSGKTLRNIVIELKHPNVRLGEKQLSQVKKYMNIIMDIPQFNASNMTWEFYLIGNKFANDHIIENELITNKPHGEQFLVFKGMQYKIFVMRWSEVIADFELRHSFLNERLSLERGKLQKQYISADNVIKSQEGSAAIAPKELASTKSIGTTI